MINKILVPIDGSEQAYKAIDVAAELTHNGSAEVVLLNVIGREQLPEAIRRFASVEHIDGPPEWQYEQLVAAGVLKAGQQHAPSDFRVTSCRQRSEKCHCVDTA